MAEPKGVRNEKGQFVKGGYFAEMGAKFKSPEEMFEKIEEYFRYCDEGVERKVYDKKTQSIVEVTEQIPYTIGGLAEYLEVNPETIINYGKKEPYFGIVMRAKTKIMNNQVIGALQFKLESRTTHLLLKNYHGLIEKQEMKVQTTGDWVYGKSSE